MTSWAKETDLTFDENSLSTEQKTDAYQEAQSVLLSLGYTQKEIAKGLKNALETEGQDAESENLLKVALQFISF